MLELTVKTLDSNNHPFTLSDEATVLQLKESIFEKIEVPICSQRLIYHGKVLRDEKKLSEYGDVNGKVIHLVERPPPSNSRPRDGSTGRRNESAPQGGNANRRFVHRDGPPTFLGSMAFPTIRIGHHNLAEGELEFPIRPSQLMAQNRLDCAQRMIGYARQSIRNMAEETPRQGRRRASTRALSAGPPTTRMSRGARHRTIQRAGQPFETGSVTDMTMFADVVSGQLAPAAHITIRRHRPEDAQRAAGAPADATPPTFHEDVASEVEISASGSSETDNAPEVRDNSTENNAAGPRQRRGTRVCASTMVPILSDIQNVNEQLAPYLQQCRTLLSSDATFDENSTPTQRDAARIFTGVTEALHSIAHAAHALSDLMVDFNEDAPRFLRCRPVVLQHSTIVEAGAPLPMNELVVPLGSEDAIPMNNSNNAPTTGPTTIDGGVVWSGFPNEIELQTMAARIMQSLRHAPHTTAGPSQASAPPDPSRPNNPPQPPNREPQPNTSRIFTTIDPVADVEVIFENIPNRDAGAGAESAANSAQTPGEGFDINDSETLGNLIMQMRNEVQEIVANEGGPSASLAAQAAALASTANLWPNSGNTDPEPNNTAPENPPGEGIEWVAPIRYDTIGSTNDYTESHYQPNLEPQTTPPRRHIPPMISMMNMVFQQNFDPALPCSSHHLRSMRGMAQPSRLRLEMFPSFDTPSTRIITRRRGSRQPPEAGATAANPNQQPPPPPTPDPSVSNLTEFNLRRFLLSLATREAPFNLSGGGMSGDEQNPSLVHDFLNTMVQAASPEDLSDFATDRYSSMLNRLRPAIREYVCRSLLGSETASPEALKRACERVFACLRPYIENLDVTPLQEAVDLSATVDYFNQIMLPRVVSLIMGTDANPSNVDFGTRLITLCTHYLRQLLAIIIHCCVESNEGFDTIIRSWVHLLTENAPDGVRLWAEEFTFNNMNIYMRGINVRREHIIRYIVFREREHPTQEPMDTDGAASVPASETASSANLVSLNTENLPEVVMGSESWHAAVPSEWVPVIARDVPRQRRQSPQKPLSDAYMSGMPPKRRKLISAAKPQGETLPQAISEGVRRAIQAAGVSSAMTERAVAEAGHDRNLQKAYKMQEKATIGPVISDDPDFTPSRFPNAHSFFKK